tara:strand:+ start:226 stop:336 length:111 start_codon:yes stop_codon:yes gene_type:complete
MKNPGSWFLINLLWQLAAVQLAAVQPAAGQWVGILL